MEKMINVSERKSKNSMMLNNYIDLMLMYSILNCLTCFGPKLNKKMIEIFASS